MLPAVTVTRPNLAQSSNLHKAATNHMHHRYGTHGFVAHGNERRQNMFRFHDGRVAEATEKNMDKAVAGTLSLSFPFLVEQKSKATQPVGKGCTSRDGIKILFMFI